MVYLFAYLSVSSFFLSIEYLKKRWEMMEIRFDRAMLRFNVNKNAALIT